MRVCLIASCPILGGAERVLLETIDVLRDRGVECRVIVPGEGPLAREIAALQIPYCVLDGSFWISWAKPSVWERVKGALRIATTVVRACRQIRAWKCDVVYTNTLSTPYGAIAARLLNLPHIWHLHEFGREDHGVYYLFGEGFSNRVLGRMSKVCLVVSNALARKYGRSIGNSKLRTVYPSMHRAHNGFAGGRTTGEVAGTKRFRIAIVGSVVEGKGQRDAIEAVSHLVHGGIDAELIIVGEGDPAYERELKGLIAQYGLESRVSFTGRVANASEYVEVADAVAVCSRSEGFGRVTIEAMFAGKPVVGADSGATPELVRDGYNGYLYRCHQSVDLAAKLKLLYENPKMLRELGSNGRNWASGYFTKERYSTEIAGVFDVL